MKRKAGSKVLITQDCRDGGSAAGRIGVYEGDFPLTVIVRLGGDYCEYWYDDWVSGEIKIGERPGVEVLPKLDKNTPEGTDCWMESDNPRIRLSDGSVIWGCQCWWCQADEQGELPTLAEGQKSQSETVEALKGLLEAIHGDKA